MRNLSSSASYNFSISSLVSPVIFIISLIGAFISIKFFVVWIFSLIYFFPKRFGLEREIKAHTWFSSLQSQLILRANLKTLIDI